jgi:RNA polymerase sigma-70 factor, ECF subfamily
VDGVKGPLGLDENNRRAMDLFLASVEKRAFRMAQIATGTSDDALDIVQEAMLGLVQKYHTKPQSLWKPLFYRILSSRIRDWYRRNRVRNRFRQWFGSAGETETEGDGNHLENFSELTNENPLNNLPGPAGDNPAGRLQVKEASKTLEKALHSLPLRQQQAFLFRAWEGLSVEETADAMRCSQGSVKTHYFRALQALRTELEDHWP